MSDVVGFSHLGNEVNIQSKKQQLNFISKANISDSENGHLKFKGSKFNAFH